MRCAHLRVHRRLYDPVSKRGTPQCQSCKKGLVWHVPPVLHIVRVRGRKRVCFDRKRHDRFVAGKRRLAIRCLDCLHVFCPACARKHFVPVWRGHDRVLRVIDDVIKKAVKGLRC